MHKNISLHKTSICGHRPNNEDVELYRLNLSNIGHAKDSMFAPIDLFIVCDGHGGVAVAQLAVSKLEKILMKPTVNYPLKNASVIKLYDHIQKSLIDHPQNIAKNCGCTALVMIRYMNNNNSSIQVINIGDSRAVLARKGLAIPLSKDHKPYWPDEKERINRVNLKSSIKRKIYYDGDDWRIGDLSVSRSFGDLDNTPHVDHIPDIFHYQLMADDEFIILACDGIWDVLKNDEVINFIKDHLADNHTEFYNIPYKYPTNANFDSYNIARKLAQYAIARGSTDNISILIVFFEK